jgi:hypothetical protein
MATSGTVAQTQINVAKLVDTAFRRAGKNPSTVSGELLDAALTSLYVLCTDFANEGVNLFCIRKNILNVIANSVQYPLAAGTDDVLNALYRNLTVLPGTPIAGVDFIGVTLDTPTAVQNVSGVFTAGGTCDLVVEYDLGSGWTTLVTFGAATLDAGSDFASDIQRPVVAAGWRIRDISGNNVIPSSVQFRTIFQELNMSQLNRDDYVNLPNKMFTGQKSLQYWYDKQINPSLYVWPMSNETADQIVVYQHGQIEDIGRLTNTLAVPPRWYEAVIFTLASRLCLEIPPEELPPGRFEIIKAQAIEYTVRAGRGESDGSSFKLQPRIGGYTR